MHLQNGATSDEAMFGYPKRIRASRKSMRQGETARYSASFSCGWQAAIISFSGEAISKSGGDAGVGKHGRYPPTTGPAVPTAVVPTAATARC